MKIVGKDLRLVKLNEEISGKEKVMGAQNPEGAMEEFFEAAWQQISRG